MRKIDVYIEKKAVFRIFLENYASERKTVNYKSVEREISDFSMPWVFDFNINFHRESAQNRKYIYFGEMRRFSGNYAKTMLSGEKLQREKL